MDPAPRAFADLPHDPELGVPVPFACGTGAPTAARLDHRRVTQSALSRVCGVCGASLGRPLAFLGSRAEADRNAFHFPASHVGCAEALRDAVTGLAAPVLGQAEPVAQWVLVTAPAFEYLRPSSEDLDRRATFLPVGVLTRAG